MAEQAMIAGSRKPSEPYPGLAVGGGVVVPVDLVGGVAAMRSGFHSIGAQVYAGLIRQFGQGGWLPYRYS
jgi:hypothetical protein